MALNVGELYASFGIDSKGLDKQLSNIEKKCGTIGKSLALVGAGLTASLTVPLVKLGKSIFESGTSFEAQMSKVEAISGASGKSLEALTSKALEMGSTTQFTATEAGQALEYMAMAGWKDESMLAGLEPVMNLAAASGGDLASTSDIVTDAMTAFGYTLESVGGDTEAFNKQVTHFTDVMAAAATNANTNVAMMGESFKYVAPLAGTLGYSIDDVAVSLGVMANAGIKGSQAGTSLSRIMQNMIKPTKQQSKAMKNLGLSLYDSNGKTKSWAEVMGDMRGAAKKSGIDMKKLQKEVGELDTKLAKGEITQKEYDKGVRKLTKGNDKFLKDVTTLAGARGLSSMLAIMNASDAEFDALTESILHCDGATAKMAATMLDNAKGDVTIFKSALEGLSITMWTIVAPAFRNIVQKATNLIDAFRKSGKHVLQGTLKWGAFAAALGPVITASGALIAALPKIAAGIAALASPLGIVIAGLALFGIAAMDVNGDMTDAFAAFSTSASNSLKTFNETLGDSIDQISKEMPRVASSIKVSLHKLIPEVVKTVTTIVEGLVKAVGDNADSIAKVGITIIEDIVNGLAEAMPTLIPTAAQAVTNILTAVVHNAPRLLIAGANLAFSIAQGILNTDWLGLGGQLLDAIKDAIIQSGVNAKGIGDKIAELINENLTGENLSALLTNATAFVGKLFDVIVAAFTTEGDVGVDVIGKIVEALNTAFGNINGEEFAGKLGKLAEAIINGIVDSITTLGAAGGDILVTIINAITGMLSNITSGDFDNMDSVAQAIMDAISNGITNIGTTAKDIVTKIGEAIGSLLGTIGSSTFTEGAGKLAKTLITGLGTAIAGAFDSAAEIVDGITSLLTGAMSEGSNVDLTSNFADLGAQIITAIGAAIKNAASSAGNLITAIGELIQSGVANMNVGDLSAFGSKIMSAIVAGLSNVGEGAAEILTAIGTALGNIDWGKLGSTLTAQALGQPFITAISNSIEGGDFSPVIEKIGSGLVSLVGNLNVACAQIAKSIVQYIINPANWVNLGKGIVTIIYTAVKSAIKALPNLLASYKQFIDDAISKLIPWGKGGEEPETQEVDVPVDGNPVVTEDDNFAAELAAALKESGALEDPEAIPVDLPVEATVTEVTETEGSDIATAAEQAFNAAMAAKKIPVSMGVTANVTVEVGTSNASTIGTTLGVDLGNAFTTAIAGYGSTVGTAAQTLVQAVNVALNSGAGKAFTAGQNTGNGFRLGILSKASEIAAAAAKVVRDAIAAANAAQDSGSPSRVMKEVGGWYGEGYAEGITGQIRNVKRAAGGMATAAVDALNADMSSPTYSLDMGQSAMRTGFNRLLGAVRGVVNAMPSGNQQIVLDTGVLVGETAPMYNDRLGSIAEWRGRGRA